ncbi:hypothetical protein [Streptomyces sp. NPDC001100]
MLGDRAGAPVGGTTVFGRDAYKQRNTVERCINRLKQSHDLAAGYDETATVQLAGLHLVAVFIRSAR